MIRAVLDANVLAAAIPAQQGLLTTLLARWLQQEFQLVSSEHILDEVERAWSKPYWQRRLAPGEAQMFLAGIRAGAEMVSITLSVSGIASHQEDDLVLATALSGDVKIVVTGDKVFLRVGSYKGVEIVSPRDFLTRLDEAGAS